MELKSYKYIQHHLEPRPWGVECQFTVEKEDGSLIDDLVMIPSIKTKDEEIAPLILTRLLAIDRPVDNTLMLEMVTQEQVEKYLKDNLIIKSTQTLVDIKTEMNKVTTVGEV